MKPTCLLFLSLLSGATALAQSKWSAGYRTGAEPISVGGFENKELRLNQQLFLSHRIYKNLEAEINFGYKNSVSNYYAGTTFDGPFYYSNYTKSSTIEYGLGIRYFIMKKNGWSPYIIGGVTGTTLFNKQSNFYTEEYTNVPIHAENKTTETSLFSKYYAGIGLNKSISKNWFLNVQTGLTYQYSGSDFTYSNEYTPKFQLGIGYCW